MSLNLSNESDDGNDICDQPLKISSNDEKNSDVTRNGSLVAHFDGKIMQDITGSMVNDTSKFLRAPKLQSSNRHNIADVVYQRFVDWNSLDQVCGLSYDTTSVNTLLYFISLAIIIFMKSFCALFLKQNCQQHQHRKLSFFNDLRNHDQHSNMNFLVMAYQRYRTVDQMLIVKWIAKTALHFVSKN